LSSEPIVLVSADGHAGAPIATYLDYVEKPFRADLEALVPADEDWRANAISQSRFSGDVLDLIDRGDAIRGGGELGAWEVERRLKELDREGVAAEVLIPGHQVALLPFFGIMNEPCSPELRMAGVRAYNRHLAEGMAQAGGRLVAIADPGPCRDMDDTVKELRWVAEHGFVGVAPPGAVEDPALPPLTASEYDLFWSACEELGLVLNIHAGWGMGQFGDFTKQLRAMTEGMSVEDQLAMQMTSETSIDQFPKDSPVRLAITRPRRVLWQLMIAGVFDRHPGLKLVFTEVRADWVPATLALLDSHFAQERSGLTKPPSEYWAQHCYAAPSSPRPYEIALRHEIGVERVMFGMDFPHPEGTWPNTREWLALTLRGVPEDEARRFMGLNAIECYGLDAARLGDVAKTIGLRVEDVFGAGDDVSERLVAQFHARSGFSRPAEQVDEPFYREMITEDEAVANGGGTAVLAPPAPARPVRRARAGAATADVAGTWEVSVTTPMGDQAGTVTLATDGGGRITGSFMSPFGELPITDGAVDGNIVTWQAEMAVPAEMILEFSADVDGDTMTGEVGLGPMGQAAFTAKRG
jgi:predicted TIM-barrel fold metal-dependent hydrolase